MDIDDADVPEIGKEDLLGLSLASLSLTEDHGDLKTYEKNVHEAMAGFPELTAKRLEEYASVFTLVGVDDTAPERRRKVLAFYTANMTKENIDQAGKVHNYSHQCLVLIDELRELMDRLISWITLCLPANEHSLSVSHRQKLKLFRGRLVTEAKRLDMRRQKVTSAHSARVETVRSMFRAKDVIEDDIPVWETTHHRLLVVQATEEYLLMCRIWLNIMDSAVLLFNYWKVNLKDDDIAFEGGNAVSEANPFFS